ncbi:uncharacterized protein YhaN [Desulfobaculum xiamenense]|uniref:Uncharacterized protein YhaN n=1 Tax=Desulfobaculum xiamenense TaxID=995050 RepID=A0A846QRF9_9BACT|nr:YhaN family protein [Desulfobaculum xiamenense]NJB68953.1 uncharacterized protein YhaN [Desulfobaculum xiamenense]
MKFLTLNLEAYGPFTNSALRFSANGFGLHVVYGPNEAGKSSALRALTNLLYGIPERTQDDFIHQTKHLRIGARIAGNDGATLDIIRRKGRKNTLLDATGQPMDEGALASHLSGVSRETFETLFGISHRTLSEGGRDILRSGGGLGESLFAAGSGIANLRDILDALRAEQDALFTPRGRNQRLNAALTQHAAKVQEARDLATAPRVFEELREEFDRRSAERNAIQRDIDDLTRRVSRLDRLCSARPIILRRDALLAEQAHVANAPLLADDFARRREAAQTALAEQSALRARLAGDVSRLTTDIAALDVPEALLDMAARVEKVATTESAHRKAQLDRPRIEGECAEFRTRATRLLAGLRPDLDLADAGCLRLNRPQRETIRSAGEQLTRATDRQSAAEQAQRDTTRALDTARTALDALPAAPDVTELAATITRAQSFGDLRTRYAEALKEHQTAQKDVQTLLDRLPLWQGDIDKLTALPVPPEESVRTAEADAQRLDDAARTLDTDIDRLRHERLRRAADLEQASSGGTVPDHAELAAARSERDRTWRLVREAWCEKSDAYRAEFETPTALADTFDRRLHEGDATADDMFRHAERVTLRETAQSDLRRIDAELTQLTDQKKRLEREREDFTARWAALWNPCGITPLDPAGMRGWLGMRAEALRHAETLRSRRQTMDGIGDTVRACIDDITACMTALAQPLDADTRLQNAIARAEALVRDAETTRQTRCDMEREIRRLAAEAQTAKAVAEDAATLHEKARLDWKQAIAPLGLASIPAPREAFAALDDITDLFVALDEAASRRTRIDDIDREFAAFSTEVNALTAALAPELTTLRPEDAASQLGVRLNQTRANAEKRALLSAQLADARSALGETETAIARAEAHLRAMCAEANVTTADALPKAETASARRRETEKALREAENQILTFTGTDDPTAFADEVTDTDPDAANAELARLTTERDRAEEQRTALDREIGSLKTRLDALDGRSRAATCAEEAEQVLAGMQTDVDRLVRLRLASAVLTTEIERYRREHQNPVLTRAAKLFSTLTLGSFDGLRADIGEGDEPVLMGTRNGDQRIEVAAMSDGTRDQLYLSLRLAALSHYLDANPPLPFVVDDILVHFDDDRSRATLGVLAELARRTQVIFFTHHTRLCELARDAVPHDLLLELNLPGC